MAIRPVVDDDIDTIAAPADVLRVRGPALVHRARSHPEHVAGGAP